MLDAQGNLYIQWVRRVPDDLGYWKAHRTQHTEKCKGKSLSPHNTPPKKQYRTTRQLWHYNTALARTQTVTINSLKIEAIFQKKQLNTASLSAKDSILMNCGRGLVDFWRVGHTNLIWKSHKYTAPSQPHKATWSLYRITLTASKETYYHTELLATSGD